MAKKNIRNLTLDLSKIASLTASEKMNMLQADSGRELLSSLTPQQLASMFPDYYLRRLPDVGANLPGVRMLKPLSRGEADSFMAGESARVRERERFRPQGRMDYPKPAYEPKWLKKLQDETGIKLSDPAAKAQLSTDKKELLQAMKDGKISSDDPRAGFLKDLSDTDLKAAGIARQTEPDGKVLYSRTETEASKLSDEQIADKLKSAAESSFSPRERATLDMIAKREGSSHQDIIFGDRGGVPGSGPYSKALGLDKRPLSDRSISEVLELQSQLTALTRRDGHGGGKGTSAVGTGQMIRGTLIQNLRDLGIPESEWSTIKFDKNLQERLTLQNFKSSGIGDPNADPSTWDMTRLGQQYESLDTRKGFRGLSETERQQIAGANPTRAPRGPITSEMVASERQRLEQLERQQQEVALAEKTIPKLPQGVDAKVAEMFDRLSPRRKQDFLAMLERAGGGNSAQQMAMGVAKVNELYKLNPEQVQLGIFSGNGRLLFSDQSVAGRAAQLAPATADALTKFEQFAPQGTTITSTYRSPEHEIERRKRTPGAHTRGAAVDIRTEGKTEEELAATIQALKRAGFTKVLLEGNPPHIHAEVNPGQDFQISNLGQGDPNIRLEVAQQAASSVLFNEPVPTQQADQRTPERPTETDRREATAQPTTPAPQPQQVSQAVPQPQQTPIDVMADGGRMNVGSNDEIKAMPIKNTKGDNSVVVDKNSNPLFTMNTKEEMANYDPRTRQVSVEPINKTDPNELAANESYGENVAANDEPAEATRNQNQMKQETFTPTIARSSTDVSMGMASNVFKDPSFERAIARTRFVNTGDAALGGHFDIGAANFG